MLDCHCFSFSVREVTAKQNVKPEESHILSHTQEQNKNRQPNSNQKCTRIQERGNLGFSGWLPPSVGMYVLLEHTEVSIPGMNTQSLSKVPADLFSHESSYWLADSLILALFSHYRGMGFGVDRQTEI